MKNLTKITVLLLFSLVLIFTMAGCSTESSSSPAKEFMDEFLGKVQSGEFVEASKMTEDPNFILFEVQENPIFSAKSQELAIEMMRDFKYKIISESTSNDKTTLEIEFTINNVGELYTNGMRGAVMANLSSLEESKSDEEISADMSVAFEAAFNETPSLLDETISVELISDGDTFSIVPTGDLLNMCIGNIFRAQQELSQAIYSAE